MGKLVGAERATLFMVDEEKGELWSQVATEMTAKEDDSRDDPQQKRRATLRRSSTRNSDDIIVKCRMTEGIVGHSVATGQVVNVPDAYEDERFYRAYDKATGFRTKSVIVVPILEKEAAATDDDGN